MDRDDEAFRRRVAESGAASGDSDESSEGPYQVREGVTRAIDDDDISTMRTDVDVTGEATHTRVESVGGFNPDAELARPPDLPHSVDVTNVAPDGTTIGGSTLTSPTGEAVGGSTLSDDIRSQAGELGGDALGRGLDFDLTVPGTQDMGSGPGGRETTGDPNVDRAISANDGSQISADGAPPAPGGAGPGAAPVDQELEDEIQMLIEEEEYEPEAARDKAIERRSRREEEYENPDADTGDNVTNLERVTVMQGSRVQPSTNPDDPAGGGSTDNWIPPADLETTPTQEGATTATTLTSSVTLGSSPVTNPTDPILGDDGSIQGGSYSGSGGSGGGDTLDSMTAMGSADASALAANGDTAGQKTDMNNVAMADPGAAFGGSVIGSGQPDDFSPPPDPPPDEDGPGAPPGGGGEEG